MVIARAWGDGRWELLLRGTEFQFGKMKRVLEVGVVMVVEQCEYTLTRLNWTLTNG